MMKFIYMLFRLTVGEIACFTKHDQIISGIDWGVLSNKIVTVSHDRNSYVWSQDGHEWVPTLVILRLNRAALCVQWSPKENKFAVGSGDKFVSVCYYEQEHNWWVSKIIRKKHNSSVTGVAWHPNNDFLATTSSDGKCRIFSTFIKGVDTRDSEVTSSSETKFGEKILQLDLSFSWAFGVKWSPSGNTLVYVGHNSMIFFIEDIGPEASAQTVSFHDLPLRDVLFISERIVVGVGFDCNPMIFTADKRGIWSFVRFMDEIKVPASSSRYGSQFSEAFGKLYGQSKHGASSDAVEPSRPRRGAHENCINCIVPLWKDGESAVKRFSTSGIALIRHITEASVLQICSELRLRVFGVDSDNTRCCPATLTQRGSREPLPGPMCSGLDGKIVIWQLNEETFA